MRYASVCSGIEAATVVWHPLGWKPVLFAEIDKFASAVFETSLPGGSQCWRLYPKISAVTADGPRYKSLGNSMAVPVMAWIGQRIQAVEDLQ